MPNPTPFRIPIAQSVVYAVRGLPEVADEYNPTHTIAPTEISLTYRCTEDSQHGRIHAYVKGRWMENGAEVPMDKPVGRHFWGRDFTGWPEWLVEEARLHDPAATPVPPPADQTAEIERMREQHMASLRRADEINNQLMEEVQRYAAGEERPVLWSVYNEMHKRALTAEARAEAMERAMESTAADALAHGGCHRKLMAQCLRAEQAEAKVADYENRITWETTCGSCARILDSSIRETEQTEAHRLALSEALGLGTGAPWDAIQERAAELAVLPAPVDRAALLRQEADQIRAHCPDHLDSDSAPGAWMVCHCDVADEMMRRLAGAPQPETEAGPRRGDAVEQWLKAQRDAAVDYPEAYQAADGLLDLYRLHADTGTPLGEHVCEGRVVGDCECLEQPAVGEQPAEAHAPSHTWTVESPRRDNWASWGTTYDDRDWALERYESAASTAPQRHFRLVRATTTYTVEAEHTPRTGPEPREAP